MADAFPSLAGVTASAAALARDLPGLCELRVIGHSRERRPLHVLSAGRGRRDVLVVAAPHADERVGPATAMRLAELVAGDPALSAGADTTWHFLLCLDPDATVRNETGPAVRRTPAAHFRHAYRPPADEQPEWAPSVRPPEDQLPESRALMDFIDERKPFLVCSLHGNDIGGSWVQLTRDVPGVADPLAKLSAEHGVPVQTGTWDAMFWRSPGPGVYVLPEPDAPEDLAGARFDSSPEDVRRGTWVRPHAYGGMTALFEVPMWAGHRVADTALHPEPRRALDGLARLLRRQGERAGALLAETRAVLPPTPDTTHLLRVAEQLTAVCPRVADDWERLHLAPLPLAAAHVAALDIAARRITLRALGLLLRLLDAPGGANRDGAARAQVRAVCERQLTRWAAEVEERHDPVWVPVDAQAELQAQTVLAVFDRLTSEDRHP